jgi:beta-lactamase regulating signal transducer with metallopeptidase domain
MQLLFLYCLKLSLSLAVVSLFYQLVLRRLTFYKWNRYFLMGYSFLCFIISFIDISPLVERDSWTGSQVAAWIPVVHTVHVTNNENTFSAITWNHVAGIVLILGITIMFTRLLSQLLSLRRLKKRAWMIPGTGPKVYEVSDSIIPFSFGESIYINKSLHSDAELREIMRHEFVHVRQRHSIDIMWSEIICILNWYNPFAWLLKFSIRQNLEFIADSEVLQAGVKKKEYQYLLLKVLGSSQFSIVQNFNLSSLKKRIAMMNKSRSAMPNLVRFLFILPLSVILLLAFRNIKTNELPSRNVKRFAGTLATEVTDTIPKSSTSSSKSTSRGSTGSVTADNFEINDDKAVVHLKNGRTEEYYLNDKAQKEKFEKKYGKIIMYRPSASASVEPTISVDGVAPTVSTTTIQRNVNCNVATTVNSNISAVVAANPKIAKAASVSTIVNGAATTVLVPAAVSAEGSPVIVDENVYSIAGNEEVLFTITKNTTKQQLDDLKNQMKEKGFNLNFTEIKYDNAGKLVSIIGTVESKDASGKFVATAFSKLIVFVINDGDHIYFRIDEQQPVKRVI